MAIENTAPPTGILKTGSKGQSKLEHIKQAIEQAAQLLSMQGPITVFIYQNRLEAFENIPFDEAIKKGAKIFGCQPYLSEEVFRQHMADGRIRFTDVQAIVQSDLGERASEPIVRLGTRLALRTAMLQYPLWLAPTAELRWFVAETDALTKFRTDAPVEFRSRIIQETQHWVMRDLRHGSERNSHSRIRKLLAGPFQHFGESSIERWSDETWEAFSLQTLWRVCRDGVQNLEASAPPPSPVRPRDVLLAATGEDSDLLVHDFLIRYCGAFLDQGFSAWSLPHRDRGFFESFCVNYGSSAGPPDLWMRGLAKELERIRTSHVAPLKSLHESLEILGIEQGQWQEYITRSLLALRGWAGMIWQMETRTDIAVHPAPPGSLIEFLAVRLILERFALEYIAKSALGYQGPLDKLKEFAKAETPKSVSNHAEQRAFLIFQLAQVLGWLPADLYKLSSAEWSTLVAEIEAFPGVERRRTFQLAFEHRYYVQSLDAITTRALKKAEAPPRPRFQAVFCIDDREESFRRHLEEFAPEAETFSVAGFYGVAMYYRGAADAHFVPLCPIVVRPKNWVVENVAYVLEDSHRRRKRTRRVLGTASHRLHMVSRTFTSGALLATGVGVLASIPLVARVLFPRLTSQIRRSASRLVQPPPITQLELERALPTPGSDDGQIGFGLEEMSRIAENVLRDLGLTSNFARTVIIIGHGSQSLNNPQNSAYNCGACGCQPGGPNARAIAEILNDRRVRWLLSERGLKVPDETVFVGAYHNTCDDSVTFQDLNRLPKSHQREFEEIREIFDEVCDRNAHERCRRFQSAPLTLSFESARRHVEQRSGDLAQTRPEIGHASNALCIVGRRERTRGLYMDRRVFLNSYDPTQDDETNSILMRILSAAVPVCAGISLEYYFSRVDSAGWGCGTKLPHNVTGLLGVMDGPASDLRQGLPWQGVELHEPMRLLFIIETIPAVMLQIMERNATIGRLFRNGWCRLATLSPTSADIDLFVNGKFERYQPESSVLPVATSSSDWYRGWRDNLGFALINS